MTGSYKFQTAIKQGVVIAALAFAPVVTVKAADHSLRVSPATFPSIDVTAAKKVLLAAEKQAGTGSPSAIVIIDVSGALVVAERMDGAFPASAKIAISKAETAIAFMQSTANLENAVNGGRTALLSAGFTMLQGGVPLSRDGRIVGAIGVSGGSKDQDEAAAEAGVGALGD